MLAYFGHHKCGSTWIAQIIEDVCAAASLKIAHHHYESFCDGDIVALSDRTKFNFWRYTNADVNFVRPVKDLLGLHVVRDPRDVIVSGYVSHYHSHPDASWPRLRHYRAYLRSLAKRDGLLAEMEFSAIFLAHMLMWDYTNPRILEMRFEGMIADSRTSFEKIFHHLGLMPLPLSTSKLKEILDRYSFERLSGGTAGWIGGPNVALEDGCARRLAQSL